MTDFSVNASQSEIDQSSDDESTSSPLPQKKPSRNVVNVDISRASKNVCDKEINLLVADPEKPDQSGKDSSAVNDLVIFKGINTEKMSEGPNLF